MRFTLGFTRTGTRIPWDSAGNPHIAVFGQSGSGKSFFLQGLIEQAAEQGAACIVLDYSQDYGQFAPRKGVCFRQVDVSSPEFNQPSGTLIRQRASRGSTPLVCHPQRLPSGDPRQFFAPTSDGPIPPGS